MAMTATVKLVALLLSLSAGLAAPSGNDTEALPCVAGNFTTEENAAITCVFSQHIEKSIHHVYVTRYPFHTDDNFTDVIKCFRLRSKEFDCKEDDGYSFRQVVENNFTFEIPRVTKRFAGRYSCSLVPPDHVPQELCFLHVEEKNSQTNSCTCASGVNGSTDMDKDVGLAFLGIFSILTTMLLGYLIYRLRKQTGGFGFLTCWRPDCQAQVVSTNSSEVERLTDAALQSDLQNENNPPSDLKPDVYEKDNAEGASILGDESDRNVSSHLKPPVDKKDHKEVAESEISIKELEGVVPPEAFKILEQEGFSDPRALKYATEDHIKQLNLKRGHEIVVWQEIKRLQQRSSGILPKRRRKPALSPSRNHDPNVRLSKTFIKDKSDDESGEHHSHETRGKDITSGSDTGYGTAQKSHERAGGPRSGRGSNTNSFETSDEKSDKGVKSDDLTTEDDN